MPKRRRLLTPRSERRLRDEKLKSNHIIQKQSEAKLEKEVSTARGRLKGALLDALDPPGEESDASGEPSPSKRDRYSSYDSKRDYSDDEDRAKRKPSPPRQSYVLKLFDRSVDLSQFDEDSPLYPICRAWIANQPKADYSKFGTKNKDSESFDDSMELPGPEGPLISRIPELLPEQKARSKENINLNYREAPPPSRTELLQSHVARWAEVRQAWIEQANKVEARYEDTQQVLNKIIVNNGFNQQ